MSVTELISKAEENSRWINANYSQLTVGYNNKWVAVLDRSVVDYDKDLKRLAARLRKKLLRRYSEAVIEYVTKKPINMVLVV